MLLVFVAGIFFSPKLSALPAFPGAEGFGIHTVAGRSGRIVRVTNLNPGGNGSFREAIASKGPRIVVFEVSGNIPVNGRLRIKHPFITVAGQTAPSPGITLTGCTLTIETHDVLIQHIRIRTGDLEGVQYDTRDCLNIGTNKDVARHYNIVVDHCSLSWSIDEVIGIAGCSNVTLSNSIISEPLSYSMHSKGEHSKALIMRNADRVTVINNIFAHSRDRNPVIQSGVKAVVANNLIYNPGEFNIRISSLQSKSQVSIVGNAVVKGKDSGYSAARKIPTIWKDPVIGTQIYLSDNASHKGVPTSPMDWSMVHNATSFSDNELEKRIKASKPPIWPNDFVALPSMYLQSKLLNTAGARPADRDLVDKRIVEEIKTKKGRIINTPSQVGGWPDLTKNRRTLNPPGDPGADRNGNGYTNLEEWLNAFSEELLVPLVERVN